MHKIKTPTPQVLDKYELTSGNREISYGAD